MQMEDLPPLVLYLVETLSPQIFSGQGQKPFGSPRSSLWLDLCLTDLQGQKLQ